MRLAAAAAMRRAIVIDAGHGGIEARGKSSAIGVRGPSGTLEKHVTLDLARRVVARLGRGAVLTRDVDVNLSLAARAAMARQRGARVFVSLHANGGIGRGAETYVHTRSSAASRALAAAIHAELAGVGGGAPDVLFGELAVLSPDLHVPATAACLLEVDYLSQTDGERRLRDPAAVDVLGAAVARGIVRFGDGDAEPRTLPVAYHRLVYNPGDRNWRLIGANRAVQTARHSAGAIRRWTTYEDYDGWEDRDFTIAHHEADHDIHVVFQIAARIGGYLKESPEYSRYVAEVRISGNSTGLGGAVDADVEDARAIWDDVLDCAAVALTLVIRIEAAEPSGGMRTVCRPLVIFGDGTTKEDHPIVTPGIGS